MILLRLVWTGLSLGSALGAVIRGEWVWAVVFACFAAAGLAVMRARREI